MYMYSSQAKNIWALLQYFTLSNTWRERVNQTAKSINQKKRENNCKLEYSYMTVVTGNSGNRVLTISDLVNMFL